MSFALAIVVFYTGLLFIILIHELGHYIVARVFGFKVLEYFVGFGPRIWSTRRGEIEYGAKVLPLGGYVKIAGMNPYEPVTPEDLPRSYGAKPIYQRALVILAGPASHLVVAAVLFSLWLAIAGDISHSPVVVARVQPRLNGHVSPAAAGGMMAGDRILSIGDRTGFTGDEMGDLLTQQAQDRPGQPVVFKIVRGNEPIGLDLTPELAPVGGQQVGRVGVILAPPVPRPVGTIQAVTGGVRWVGRGIVDSVRQIGHVFGPQGVGRTFSLLFTDAPRASSDPASVVGIGQQVGAIGSAGQWADIIWVLAFVTVFIGLVNLLPLPPFDGGHLAVLLIERVRGKAVDMRRVIPVSAVVLGFFAMFVTATVFLDITKPISAP
jgi:membrane-associated protease RseP (regulator of RpoE activity)